MENNTIMDRINAGIAAYDKEQGESFLSALQAVLDWGKAHLEGFEENELSDGHHTFNELYEFRKMYNACLFNEWAAQGKFEVHKSWRHNDGLECFPHSRHTWFIVSAKLPAGIISNHYKSDDWELFQVPEVENALFEYDGHTGTDVLERMRLLITTK